MYFHKEQCIGREGELRLAGGTNLSGRVEVCVREQWGTVCDDAWTDVDASVACYQLGLSRISECICYYNIYKNVKGNCL